MSVKVFLAPTSMCAHEMLSGLEENMKHLHASFPHLWNGYYLTHCSQQS